jgi:cytidylate kinase
MIRLIGPGGAGKSTIGALLAERLRVPLVDLDRHFAGNVGDISDYEAVIRTRFEIYMALPIRKVETMRPRAAIVDEILAALSPANYSP